jgi:hypothetical protein
MPSSAASRSGYFASLLLAASFLPGWVALAVCGLAVLVNLLTILVPSNTDVTFVWRYRAPDAAVRSIPWGRWVICEFTILTLGTMDLALMACGSTLLASTRPAESMPITTGIGLVLAWLAPGALCALVVQSLLGRLRDPARPCRPVLHVSGDGTALHRSTLQRFFAQHGWKARFAPALPGPLDVRVRLGADSPPPEADAPWPLPVGAAALQSREVLERLARRDEIQKRRRLVSGLERLFKIAARRTFRCGSGFWVAPHYWFVPGLRRDTPEEELNLTDGTMLADIVGPPYHRVLPRPVRHHVYRILRALQIDLIFVEDGVNFKRFCRILRLMFEVFDVYGGRRRADEIHFHGVPGTRVLIHEFVLHEPFRSETYPEPEYENLGRARILHVFRDRGEQEDRLETPRDTSSLPAPSLMH